jgi:hypothetical protein
VRDEPVRIVQIGFVHADGRPVEATVAKGPGGFICRRGPDEELDAFKARADEECRLEIEAKGRPQAPAILIFMDQEEEPSDATYR